MHVQMLQLGLLRLSKQARGGSQSTKSRYCQQPDQLPPPGLQAPGLIVRHQRWPKGTTSTPRTKAGSQQHLHSAHMYSSGPMATQPHVKSRMHASAHACEVEGKVKHVHV